MVASLDNAPIHGGVAAYRELGLRSGQRLELPSLSPDVHKVAEHAIARLKQGVRQHLYKHPDCITSSQLQAALPGIHKQVNPPEVVLKDVLSLQCTYAAIATPAGLQAPVATGANVTGTGGDWAPKRLR
jgi:hypothetical protein